MSNNSINNKRCTAKEPYSGYAAHNDGSEEFHIQFAYTEQEKESACSKPAIWH